MTKSIFALNRPLTPQELVERRRTLVRLGLAWLAMMQVMMFALPGYLRVDAGPNDSLEVLDWAIFLMNWASFVMTVPVVLYAAWPMWRGLAKAISQRRINMDVPVTISIIAAFVPSAIATMTGSGEVYFDSVTMFVAFLLTARYFETRARQSVDLIESGQMQSQLCDPLLNRSDRVATLFILVQLAFSLMIGMVWFKLSPDHALTVLVSMLVMSCPCALSLAAPISLAAAHATIAAYPSMTGGQRLALFEQTRKVTRQNLYGSLIWHVLTMPVAAVGLVTPWVAALAMFLSSAAVVFNAWRLYRIPHDVRDDGSARSAPVRAGEPV